ncbi:MAG: hypothetical protein J0L70_27285 [Leptolyngbya sp. UWPOB_LEPTO1]|uniref:hypothetical protein n=1 Tax=Leptolyngbya sp. UWPOB_LEPTO1 TaxID=2815653 RepID=UPI001ACEA189|nr:hypothetical protein [Leptolyngbya sp. UWPOB_LEPTO1]MBN8564242.1 hypothetical protein [Leptolyngbya sp. UWPOB_LEPTO1]
MIKISGQRVLLHAAILLATAGIASPARSDEVWDSDYGRVVYQADRGKTAILTYGDAVQGALFIDGLAGQLQDRRNYSGYWSQSTSNVRCETYREGRNGQKTYYWGTLHIQFLDSEFPSRWSATIGYCDQPKKLGWRASPIVGGVQQPLKFP